MNSKIVALVTLFAILFGCAYANQEASTIGLSVFGSSNQWWIAVAPQNAAYDVALIEVQESGSSDYNSMLHDASWGYWQLASSSGNPTGFNLPLTLRLTATNGQQVVMNSILPTISAGSVVNTNVQFGSTVTPTPTVTPTVTPSVAPEQGSGGSHTPTRAPTHAPTEAPTEAPSNGHGHGHGSATEAPTHAPTKAPTHAPTKAPTQAPTQASSHGNTKAPTQAPTHAAATQAPTKGPTKAPTKAPTGAPSSSGSGSGSTNLCTVTATSSEPIKLLIPLYIDPSDGNAWSQVATAAKSGVPTIAIINPNSGPASTAGSDYTTGMAQLAAAGVTMLGYVHTSYGARAISDVTSDISTYASQYPGLAGIFIDEASTEASELPYYTQVYQAITSHSGYVNAILNPGTQPDEGYMAVSTNLMVFEDNASNLKSSDFPSWVTCAPTAAEKAGYKYRFSAVAIDAAQGNMASLISTMETAGIGMVYVTDATLSGNTYGVLPSYFTTEVSTLSSIN